MKRFKILLSCLLLCFSSISFANEDPLTLNKTLEQLEKNVIETKAKKVDAENQLRNEALQRAAVVYGAQSGRYARWQQLEKDLFERSSMLANVFNFKAMYLENGLLQPPVLDISSNVTNISNSGQTRELINNVYRVLLPATFKQRPLTWESFLLPDTFSKPVFPRDILLPKNDDEKSIWKDSLAQGWRQGVEQANNEFSVRLAALDNAYQGMFLYTVLAMRGQIAPPQVVTIRKSVENSNDNQKMAVGIEQQVITQNSYFVAEPNHWKPIYYPHSFALDGKPI